jgi:hypothetical protein
MKWAHFAFSVVALHLHDGRADTTLSPRLAFGVKTCSAYLRTRAVAVKATWASKVPTSQSTRMRAIMPRFDANRS